MKLMEEAEHVKQTIANKEVWGYDIILIPKLC